MIPWETIHKYEDNTNTRTDKKKLGAWCGLNLGGPGWSSIAAFRNITLTLWDP